MRSLGWVGWVGELFGKEILPAQLKTQSSSHMQIATRPNVREDIVSNEDRPNVREVIEVDRNVRRYVQHFVISNEPKGD